MESNINNSGSGGEKQRDSTGSGTNNITKSKDDSSKGGSRTFVEEGSGRKDERRRFSENNRGTRYYRKRIGNYFNTQRKFKPYLGKKVNPFFIPMPLKPNSRHIAEKKVNQEVIQRFRKYDEFINRLSYEPEPEDYPNFNPVTYGYNHPQFPNIQHQKFPNPNVIMKNSNIYEKNPEQVNFRGRREETNESNIHTQSFSPQTNSFSYLQENKIFNSQNQELSPSQSNDNQINVNMNNPIYNNNLVKNGPIPVEREVVKAHSFNAGQGYFHNYYKKKREKQEHWRSLVGFAEESRTLFIRNIGIKIPDLEISKKFSVYGDILNIFTGSKNRGFVMVTYFDIRDAVKAKKKLNGEMISDRKIDIHYSFPRHPGNSNVSEKNEGKIVIRNVTPKLSNKDLGKILRKYGEIKQISEIPDDIDNQRFIEFYDLRAACHVRNILDRTIFWGRKVDVNLLFRQSSELKEYMKTYELNSKIGNSQIPEKSETTPPEIFFGVIKAKTRVKPEEKPEEKQRRFSSATSSLFHRKRYFSNSDESKQQNFNNRNISNRNIEDIHNLRYSSNSEIRRKSFHTGYVNTNTNINTIGYENSHHREDSRKQRKKSLSLSSLSKNIENNYISLEDIESRKDFRTTLMIRNIPNSLRRKDFFEIYLKKYSGTYDFFYLPMDKKSNKGYAFINFKKPSFIIQFHEDYHNTAWSSILFTDKICILCYARIQGIENLTNHFKKSSELENYSEEVTPVFL